MKRKSAIILATAGLLMTISVCFGLTAWDRQLNWNLSASIQFEVYQDEALTIPLYSGSNLNIEDPGSSYSETYYIKNIGNVDINVTAGITFSGVSTADYSWAPSNEITIPKDGNGSIALTLSNFSVGSGSCQITLQSDVAP